MAGSAGDHIFMLTKKLDEAGQALHEEEGRVAAFKMANEYLQKESQNVKNAYAKLENHAKECEKAVEKAQKSSKQDKNWAESTVKIQRVHLKTAEQTIAERNKSLLEWRSKYGWNVDAPAQEKLALQASLAEWQSKAETFQIQIASLEEQIQGTPERIGLHQALEQWDEHQACSAGFADLEDKMYDANMLKEKLESELQTVKQRYQKAKSEITELRDRVKQLEEASMTSQGLPITSEQVEQAEKAFQELQIKTNQLEQENQALQSQDKISEYIQRIQKLESDLQAVTEERQAKDVKMKALEDQNDQLQQANNAFLGQDGSHTEMLQKLESDLKMEQEQHQATKLNMDVLQGKADQLESDLKVAKEQNQTINSNAEALQAKTGQLESDLTVAKEQNETISSNAEALRAKTGKLESDLTAAKEQNDTMNLSMEALQAKRGQLESDLTAAKNENETINSSMEALRAKTGQLEVDLRIAKEQNLSMEALQGKASQLESDLTAAKEQNQKTNLNMEALQGKADQLDSHLRAANNHDQTTTSSMEALQEKVDQLESELKTQKEHNQKLKEMLEDDADDYPGPGIEVLEAQAEEDRLWTENQEKLKAEARVLKAKKDESDQKLYKLEMEALEQKIKKAEEDPELLPELLVAVRREVGAAKIKVRKDFGPEVVEAVQREIEAEKSKQVENSNPEMVEPVRPAIEGSRKLYPQLYPQWKSKKGLEQDKKAPHMENETHQASGHSQIAPPMSPIYTTDEGSLDLEKTPRPKTSLRQDLGYSSRDHSEKWSSDVSLPQHQGGKMSKPAEKSDENLSQDQVGLLLKPVWKGDVKPPQFRPGKLSKPGEKANVSPPKFKGKKTSKQADMDFWTSSDDSDDADDLIESPMGRKITKRQSIERRAKTMAAREIRAKEQSEALVSIFECTEAKAHTIDRRLKALGPGCRLQEAPALVAYELSGIPEDTYKGLVSGQLLATMPPKEADGTGTTSMHSIGTDTTDLPTEEVTHPVLLTEEVATDTTVLPNDNSMITETDDLRSGTLSNYIMPFLILLMILLSIYYLYMDYTSNQSPKTANGVVYKNAYSLRYMPTPSITTATPVTFAYPPTPAPQLGLARMLMASPLGRGVVGGRW